MKSALVFAAALAATTTVALADVTRGADAADYTQTERSLINEAARENNGAALKFYLSHQNRKPAASAEAVTPGEAQLAARLGLDPSLYTQAELNLIEAARRDSNRSAEAFYINHLNRQS